MRPFRRFGTYANRWIFRIFKLGEDGDKTMLTIEAGRLEEKYITMDSP